MDLARTHASLSAEILQDFAELMETGAFVNGPAVARFEEAFAAETGVARCVGMSSGLDALRIALIAAGLERGEEVIVPAMTFVATLEAVTQAGGVPVVADIQEADFNLDPDAAAAAITDRTRFVLPVHLYGQLADMRRLGSLGLPLIEDACQAPGAARDGLRAGTGGLAAAFSFYPSKNLGAMGDAGALVTDNDELADLALALREHGQRRKYEHEAEGYTARLDTMQAIVLLRKLPSAPALERRAAGNRDPVSRSTGGCRRSSASSGSSGQRARLAPLRRSDGRAGPARRAPGRTRRPDGPPLSSPGSSDRGVRVPRAGRRELPRGRGPRPRVPVPPDLPRHARGRGRARGRGGEGVLRPWLTHRPTTPRSARSST